MVKKAGGLFRVFLMVLVATLAVSLAGCQFIKIEEGERTPLEYTIVKQEEIPAEAAELMEQKKENAFQMTYLTITLESKSTATRFGIAIRAFRISATVHTRFSEITGAIAATAM